jgi:tRNA U34 5-methylaminomethyl-2-thiouridine-forming methyltransferase MnmC
VAFGDQIADDITDSILQKCRMDTPSVFIAAQLEDGNIINIEATPIGEQQVAIPTIPFKDIKASIVSVSKEIADALQQVQPSKASVKFGFEVALKEGELTALLVKGSGKANLEITLEWSNSDKPVA